MKEKFLKIIFKDTKNSQNKKKNYEFDKVEFKNCFPSTSLKEVDKYSKISISNGRHILFTGKEEVGITSIAKWISSKYSKNKEKDFTFVFTEETTIGDLIGRFSPTYSDNITKNIISWKDGPLIEAIKGGYSGLFLNIHTTDSKILERINCLLDQKEGQSEYIFELPENPDVKKVIIDTNFHFFCTCPLDKLSTLSDAFLNRLTVIVIEDQLEQMEKNDIKELIKNFMLQEELKINIPDDLVEELTEFQMNSNLSMSKLSKLSKCCFNLSIRFKDLEPKSNIKYVQQLLGNDNEFSIPQCLQKDVNSKLEEYDKNESQENEGFYLELTKIKDLITNLYSCMICNIHVCLIGKTGIGKTSFAKTFSQIFRKKDDFTLYNILFSFNSESTIENLYGTFAFQNGKINIVEGPLYKAINKGLIFIADEFNLAEESIIQSFMNILEIKSPSSKILIPGINELISYNRDCFIIICQNDSNIRGRREIPNSIKKK